MQAKAVQPQLFRGLHLCQQVDGYEVLVSELTVGEKVGLGACGYHGIVGGDGRCGTR
jgi:hypothetical protein